LETNINAPYGTRARLDLGLAQRKLSPLRLLSAITLIYLCIAAAFLYSVGTNPLFLFVGVVWTFPDFFTIAVSMAPAWVLVAIVGGILAFPYFRRRLRENPIEVALIAIYSSLFTLVFGLVKTHLPAVFPFWADDFLTRIDLVMTPRSSVAWMDAIDLSIIRTIYFDLWIVTSTLFPMIMVIVDPNESRRRIFTVLWAVCWIGLGNILAAAFMSFGPIFLDRVPGGDPSVYPEVFELLARPEAAPIVQVKEELWNAYAIGDYIVGSGISAFPSVHVGMATVVALYLATILSAQARACRSKIARGVSRLGAVLLPVAIVLTYQFVTVYIGMHYAIDGYVSIFVILLLYRLIARREQAGETIRQGG